MISSKILLIGLLICIAYVKVYIISFKNLDSFTFLILNFFLKRNQNQPIAHIMQTHLFQQ